MLILGPEELSVKTPANHSQIIEKGVAVKAFRIIRRRVMLTGLMVLPPFSLSRSEASTVYAIYREGDVTMT